MDLFLFFPSLLREGLVWLYDHLGLSVFFTEHSALALKDFVAHHLPFWHINVLFVIRGIVSEVLASFLYGL